MPEIQIRQAVAADIPHLVALEHYYSSDHVWQMEIEPDRPEGKLDGSIYVHFREVRLPRSIRVEYPRSPRILTSNWRACSCMLVACINEHPVGYASLMLDTIPQATWLKDLVVHRPLRRKGIGTALLLVSQEWAGNAESQCLVMEMQTKNFPAIQFARKMGFDFCGYNDHYYASHEIGIFFSKLLR